MAVLVDLTPEEIQELKALTKETVEEAAVRSAMTEYLRFARRMQLKELSGKVEMDENWRSLEELELRDGNGDGQISSG
ncbi:MAG: hypothetical protein WD894_18120 [Pirellulales bacterium]